LTRFSARTARDRTRNALAEAVEKVRARGGELIDLTLSNPTAADLGCDVRAILEPLADVRALRYEPEALGLLAAREAVARELERDGIRVPVERIVLTASTSEAYAFLFKLLCDPGDDVLVPVPSYPLLDHLAGLEGVRLVPYALRYATGVWCVDLESVRAARTPRTRAIVVVTPNNPTGSLLGANELDALAATGLPIVSDEVFAGYPLQPAPGRARSALEARGASLVCALGGLSKLAGLPQMKVAWMALGGESRAVAEALARLEWIADAFLSVATPQQHALPRWLEWGRRMRSAISARARRNLESLARAVSGTPASLLGVEAGWYATLRLPATRSEEEWAIGLVEQDGVLAHPGWLYDFAAGPHLVLSLLVPERDFDAGVERIRARLCGA
jgi:hypothetical protein